MKMKAAESDLFMSLVLNMSAALNVSLRSVPSSQEESEHISLLFIATLYLPFQLNSRSFHPAELFPGVTACTCVRVKQCTMLEK